MASVDESSRKPSKQALALIPAEKLKEDVTMDMSYLKDMPIAILGAGAVGKTMAADCALEARSPPVGPAPLRQDQLYQH